MPSQMLVILSEAFLAAVSYLCLVRIPDDGKQIYHGEQHYRGRNLRTFSKPGRGDGRLLAAAFLLYVLILLIALGLNQENILSLGENTGPERGKRGKKNGRALDVLHGLLQEEPCFSGRDFLVFHAGMGRGSVTFIF